jgi:hypothetical protein
MQVPPGINIAHYAIKPVKYMMNTAGDGSRRFNNEKATSCNDVSDINDYNSPSNFGTGRCRC